MISSNTQETILMKIVWRWNRRRESFSKTSLNLLKIIIKKVLRGKKIWSIWKLLIRIRPCKNPFKTMNFKGKNKKYFTQKKLTPWKFQKHPQKCCVLRILWGREKTLPHIHIRMRQCQFRFQKNYRVCKRMRIQRIPLNSAWRSMGFRQQSVNFSKDRSKNMRRTFWMNHFRGMKWRNFCLTKNLKKKAFSSFNYDMYYLLINC